jgi:hypothetical protein
MDRSEEGPVQPSATLRDEFGNLGKYVNTHIIIVVSTHTCGDISRSLCTLDVSETIERVEGAVQR